MGAILSLPFTLLNFLLPFTRPGTPLSQDLLHTAVLCGTLYFAPQIGEWYNAQQQQRQQQQHGDSPSEQDEEHNAHNQADNSDLGNGEPEGDDPPLDERLVLQDDGEDDNGTGIARPPRAPTPPPMRHQAHVEDDNDDGHPARPPNHHRHHQQDEDPNLFAPGPANPPPQNPRAPPTHRTVGTKKAKSLARKDQQRAYNEWLRQEAEIRRRQEDEGREEREAALALERERRAAAEEVIRAKEREEREALKREREREAEEEAARRERVVSYVRRKIEEQGCVDLLEAAWKEGKDKTWVERVVRASGLLGQLQTEGSRVMLTGTDWLVKIDEQVMAKAYAEAEQFGQDNGGKLGFKDFGNILEKVVLEKVGA